jgi:glycosyltransferase involved in cell wall biosynthesis
VSGFFLSRRHRVPFIFEVRDLWPETLIDMGAISERSLTARFFRALEGFLYRRAAKIITPLPRAYDYISRFGIEEAKIVWIPNGVDFQRFSRVQPAPARETFTLMYFGAHGAANGLSNVIDAMKGLAAHRIRLRLIGDGPEKMDLIKRAAGVTSISFEPPVPKDAIPSLATQADAFVFNLINAPVFRFGISPNKLSDFMAAARPVIFACDAVNNPVQDSAAGISVAPQDPKALAEAILTMSHTPLADRNRMGQRGRQYVAQNYSFDKLAEKFAATLDNVLSR